MDDDDAVVVCIAAVDAAYISERGLTRDLGR